jgi:DNA-binding transcriptional MocR family regulator/dihydrodipicolinate reductase
MSQYPQYTIPEELVHLGVGQPSPALLPLEGIRKAAANRFGFDDPWLLQYGDIPGYANLRKALAEWLNKQEGYKSTIDPSTLFITNGNTGALTLICTFFTSTGDVVYAEEPSYFLALNTFKDFRLKVDVIRTDKHGLDVDFLEEKLKKTPPHLRPKFIYVIPSYNNPCGVTLSHERRIKLVELSETYNFLIVADEVYQLLGFNDPNPLQHMYSYDKKGTVFSCGSFSKILAPALRLGWIQASKELLQKFMRSGQLDSSGALNPMVSAIVHSAIELGVQQEHLEKVKAALNKGCEVLCKQLKESLPAYVEFTAPIGGYFVWIKLPTNFDAEELLPLAREKHQVAFQPGIKFSAVGALKNFLRVSFSYYNEEKLAEGAKRLGAAIREYAEKVASTPAKPIEAPRPVPPVRVAVHGSTGKLGSLIVQHLGSGKYNAVYAGPIGRTGEIPDADVVIDVSVAEGTKNLLPRLLGQPLIVGTTGDLPIRELHEYATKTPVAVYPNFSVGLPLMLHLLQETKKSIPSDWSIEIVEAHHTAKRDAPSGTAKRLAAVLTDAVTPNVPTHSLRAGDTVGEHTVWLAGAGERLEIKHVATQRDVFAIGAVRAAIQIKNQPTGIYYK